MKEELELKLIEKYPEFFGELKREEGPMHSIKLFGMECNDGWYDILDKLMLNIKTYLDNKPEDEKFMVTLHQIKEKFGGLRFYIDHGDDYIYELINAAENESFETCEDCGSKENIGRTTSRWYMVKCEKCSKDIDANYEWKSNEELKAARLERERIIKEANDITGSPE